MKPGVELSEAASGSATNRMHTLARAGNRATRQVRKRAPRRRDRVITTVRRHASSFRSTAPRRGLISERGEGVFENGQALGEQALAHDERRQETQHVTEGSARQHD